MGGRSGPVGTAVLPSNYISPFCLPRKMGRFEGRMGSAGPFGLAACCWPRNGRIAARSGASARSRIGRPSLATLASVEARLAPTTRLLLAAPHPAHPTQRRTPTTCSRRPAPRTTELRWAALWPEGLPTACGGGRAPARPTQAGTDGSAGALCHARASCCCVGGGGVGWGVHEGGPRARLEWQVRRLRALGDPYGPKVPRCGPGTGCTASTRPPSFSATFL